MIALIKLECCTDSTTHPRPFKMCQLIKHHTNLQESHTHEQTHTRTRMVSVLKFVDPLLRVQLDESLLDMYEDDIAVHELQQQQQDSLMGMGMEHMGIQNTEFIDVGAEVWVDEDLNTKYCENAENEGDNWGYGMESMEDGENGIQDMGHGREDGQGSKDWDNREEDEGDTYWFEDFESQAPATKKQRRHFFAF